MIQEKYQKGALYRGNLDGITSNYTYMRKYRDDRIFRRCDGEIVVFDVDIDKDKLSSLRKVAE